jgi:hypothetical protein
MTGSQPTTSSGQRSTSPTMRTAAQKESSATSVVIFRCLLHSAVWPEVNDCALAVDIVMSVGAEPSFAPDRYESATE